MELFKWLKRKLKNIIHGKVGKMWMLKMEALPRKSHSFIEDGRTPYKE
jgi:hypothetical protein